MASTQSIDSRNAEAAFLPYQLEWIKDDSRMRLAEKSVRIGWTYADAFKNVRKRLRFAKRDYLFSTADQASAAEYVSTCMEFVGMYESARRSVISRGEDSMKVPVMNEDGTLSKLTEEVRFCYIKFDNGSRIMAFSSNPNAMRVYGGDVGLDEFSAHKNQALMYEVAQGRITMGYDMGIWSAHNGTDTLFAEFAREARAGKGGWSYYRVTMEDAVNQGYLDMIQRKTGKRWTKEDWLADCRRRARLEDIFQQAYMCNPRGSSLSAVAWSVIELCESPYKEYERAHLEAEGVRQLFGEYREAARDQRTQVIHKWLAGNFAEAKARRARHSLGFDVAASGQGDLGVLYIDQCEEAVQTLRALLTFRTEDWHFIETCARWFMDRMTDIHGAGDETGLGRQVCWNLARAYEGRFEPVNFASSKHELGFGLIEAMSLERKRWPVTEPDLSQDFFALRKSPGAGGKYKFSEGPNVLNPASHCDMAWAGALATHARASLVSTPFHHESTGGLWRGDADDGLGDDWGERSPIAHAHLI